MKTRMRVCLRVFGTLLIGAVISTVYWGFLDHHYPTLAFISVCWGTSFGYVVFERMWDSL